MRSSHPPDNVTPFVIDETAKVDAILDVYPDGVLRVYTSSIFLIENRRMKTVSDEIK